MTMVSAWETMANSDSMREISPVSSKTLLFLPMNSTALHSSASREAPRLALLDLK